MIIQHTVFSCLLLLGCLFSFPLLADVKKLLVVADIKHPFHEQLIQALRTKLHEDKYAIEIHDHNKWPLPARTHHDLIIAIGIQAAQNQAMLTPTLYLSITRTEFEKITQSVDYKHKDRFSAIFSEQPFHRQLELIRMLPGNFTRIGVLYSEDSKNIIPQLKAVAEKKNLTIVDQQADLNSSLPLTSVVTDLIQRQHSEILLAIPDIKIYNRKTIKGLLMTGYRHRVPLVGYSQHYVVAGALAAVYSTPEQIARQAAEIISADLAQDKPPGSQLQQTEKGSSSRGHDPKYFSVEVNPYVNLALHLSPINEQNIYSALTQADIADE